MDNKIENGGHKLNLYNRQNAEITGIVKVISIEEQQINLITNAGRLVINGKGLRAGKLDVSTGVLEFSGQITGLNYSEYKTPSQKATGFVGKLFK